MTSIFSRKTIYYHISGSLFAAQLIYLVDTVSISFSIIMLFM